MDHSWSSTGMPREAAFLRWRDWASSMIASMDIKVPDPTRFAAEQQTIMLGPVALLTVRATEQQIIHRGEKASDPMFQLLFSRSKHFQTRVADRDFTLKQGEFVLLDNTRSYEMRTQDAHAAIDLVMPQSWLERWIPEPWTAVAQPFPTTGSWGAPLGKLLTAMADEIGSATLPRAMLADQVGALLALAVGQRPAGSGSHRSRVRRRILAIIEDGYADPQLDIDQVAREAGISRRYLQSLLAEAGMTFVGCLNGVRLDRASQLLLDSARTGYRTSEIAWMCGFRDPDYFARMFRKRFGLSPTQWRTRTLA